MMQRLTWFTGILVLAPLLALAQSLEEGWSRGNQAFADQAFPEAIAAYEEALTYGQSANLHFNLANTYSAAEDPGRAILHYLKALAIDPHHSAARTNLHLTRQQAGLDTRTPALWVRWAENLPLTLWIVGATVAFWMLLALWWLLRRRINAPRTRFVLSSIALASLIAALPALYGYHLMGQVGVVIDGGTLLRVAPVPESPTTASMPAGEIASIRRQTNGFYLVELPSGEEGYLAPSEIRPVWDSIERSQEPPNAAESPSQTD